MTLKLCLLVFLAGGTGALSRWGLTTIMARLLGTGFPFGTFAANILGSFLFGLVYELASVRGILADSTRIALCVGFMGSFTTFSSLMFDSWSLGQTRPLLLVANIVLQVILGLAALTLGMWAARGA